MMVEHGWVPLQFGNPPLQRALAAREIFGRSGMLSLSPPRARVDMVPMRFLY